jgi:hypothetical protein
MANVIPYAFRGELFTGTHNFASGGDQFKLALYTSNPYNTSSTVYVTTNEVSSAGGTNYTAAGNDLGSNAVVYSTAVASCDFADTSWTSATITAAFGVIFNDDQSDKICVVLDFDGSKSCTNGTFTISFPSPSTAADAIISMA